LRLRVVEAKGTDIELRSVTAGETQKMGWYRQRMNGTVKPLKAKTQLFIEYSNAGNRTPKCQRTPGGGPYKTSQCFAELDHESRDCFRKRGVLGG
jgi:hypothetical protein